MDPVHIEKKKTKCSVGKNNLTVSKGSVSMTFCDKKKGRGLERKVRTQRQSPLEDR